MHSNKHLCWQGADSSVLLWLCVAMQDDIGDKSVFLFQALPREEQEKLLAGLERREGGQ